MLPPGERAQRGAAELDAAFARMHGTPRTHEVIDYRIEVEELNEFGQIAVEWGAIHGTAMEIATGQTARSSYHVMRILKRQSDGDWKVYRSIWTPAD